MSTNKNAQLRYRILDTCFKNRHRQYTIGDLVEEVNRQLEDIYGIRVSLRQIREDIKFMRDSVGYDAPIEAYPYDGKKCYYSYSDPEFSIFTSELSEEEVSKLRSTIKFLERFRGLPSYAWVEEVISNLEYRFGGVSNKENVISFDQNTRLAGLEHLPVLIEAAVDHRTLDILYRSFKGNEYVARVHPYHLKQYNGRWFLLALEEYDTGRKLSTLALDRMVKISPSDRTFIPNTEYDFTHWFDDIVGVTKTVPDGAQKEKVVLRFSPSRFPYVVTKPLHSSQQVLSEEGCTVQLEVYPNPELRSLIFSFIPDVEVLAPEWLREEFRQKIEENLKKYLSVKNGCTEG